MDGYCVHNCVQEKYYSDDAAIPAATSFWSSVFGGEGDGESNGENDWATVR